MATGTACRAPSLGLATIVLERRKILKLEPLKIAIEHFLDQNGLLQACAEKALERAMEEAQVPSTSPSVRVPLCAKLTHKKHRHTYSWVQRRTNVYGRVWAMFWTIFDRTDMKISLYR